MTTLTTPVNYATEEILQWRLQSARHAASQRVSPTTTISTSTLRVSPIDYNMATQEECNAQDTLERLKDKVEALIGQIENVLVIPPISMSML